MNRVEFMQSTKRFCTEHVALENALRQFYATNCGVTAGEIQNKKLRDRKPLSRKQIALMFAGIGYSDTFCSQH